MYDRKERLKHSLIGDNNNPIRIPNDSRVFRFFRGCDHCSADIGRDGAVALRASASVVTWC